MPWFKLKKTKDVPQSQIVPTVPFKSYRPILHRALELTLDYEPLFERILSYTGNGESDEFKAKLACVDQEAFMSYRALATAMVALRVVRPDESALRDLHKAAGDFVYARYSYYGSSNSEYLSRMRPEQRDSWDESLKWRRISEELKVRLQTAMRSLHTSQRGLYDRLAFTDHELVWLVLDDLAE